METSEQVFLCPYCGEEISMILDVSEGNARLVQDCDVCCKPIEIHFRVEDEVIVDLEARRNDE